MNRIRKNNSMRMNEDETACPDKSGNEKKKEKRKKERVGSYQ